jgi:hypothetical protein
MPIGRTWPERVECDLQFGARARERINGAHRRSGLNLAANQVLGFEFAQTAPVQRRPISSLVLWKRGQKATSTWLLSVARLRDVSLRPMIGLREALPPRSSRSSTYSCGEPAAVAQTLATE